MPGSKSDYAEKVVLDLLLGAKGFTPPATCYIALSTAAYSDAATGTNMNEVSTSGTGYARVAVTNNATNWPDATGNSPASKANGTQQTWPAATAAWGTMTSAYICDAPTGGNVLYGGDVATAKAVATGDTATIAVGAFTITED